MSQLFSGKDRVTQSHPLVVFFEGIKNKIKGIKKASASALAYGVGKLPTSRRYNQLPLLRSSPGGFARSWPYRTYPYVLNLSSAKVRKNYDVTNIKGHFLSSHGHKRTFWRENRTQTAYFTHFFTKFATQIQQPFGLSPLP